jgi:hypothetical protein
MWPKFRLVGNVNHLITLVTWSKFRLVSNVNHLITLVMWPKFRLVGNCPPPDLLGCTAAGGVGDGPGRLLTGLELGLRLDVYQHREYVCVYHGLNKVKN